MASITKRGNSWSCCVWHDKKRYTKSFPTKAAAEKWARLKKAELESAPRLKSKVVESYTMDYLLHRYIDEVHPHRPFARSKMTTIKMTAEHFKDVRVIQLTPDMLFKYAEKRRAGYKGRAPISRSTLNQQLTYVAQTIDHARTLWGVDLSSNPARDALSALSKIGLVGGSRRRERRVSDQELKLLMEASLNHHSGWIGPIIMLAVETGMRQGEIQALQWKDVDFERNTVFIKDRKHPSEKLGNNQIIPVSNKALEVLKKWVPVESKRTGAVFPGVKLAQSISDRFVKVREEAGLPELHFHDLRHEAVSRFFEKGLQIQEVARISGHKDWKQLLRYTQLNASSLVDKLNG